MATAFSPPRQTGRAEVFDYFFQKIIEFSICEEIEPEGLLCR
jgi:hypothetical protein